MSISDIIYVHMDTYITAYKNIVDFSDVIILKRMKMLSLYLTDSILHYFR